MNRYLLEIGVEEFPAGYVKGMINQLNKYFSEELNENSLAFDEIKIESTPRRFTVLINNIYQESDEKSEEVRGPSAKIAYKDGEPTKALLGFLKGQGASLEDLIIKEFKEEDYVFINKIIELRPIDEILKDIVPQVIKRLNSPKTMKWGGKNLRFARPIRYFLSLYNDEILSFDLEGIIVSNKTKGHRDLGSSKIIIDSIDNYKNLLRENGVILERSERKKIIKSESIKLAKANGGELVFIEELLNELVDINEYPTPFIGSFDKRYLSLPKEVIITVMVDHQRYFAMTDGEGNLMPNFIAVRNGNSEGIDNVREGNEKVIEPRLSDAEFFYNEDLSKKLEEFIPRLETASFHEDLGSIYDKSQRLIKLGDLIGDQLAVGEEVIENVRRAAFLSKADLVTNMVTEFTELQGLMGKIYALASKEKTLVAQAIEEQYMPVRADGDLPQSTAGMILSIADKLDSICAMYAVGVRVTGSQDPFALRRAALGIINIILDKNLNLDLDQMIKDGLYTALEDQSLVFDYNQVKEDILEFFLGRYRSILIDKGERYDIVDAVFATGDYNIYQLNEKVNALTDFLDKNEHVMETINRVANITKDFDKINIKEELFNQDEEKELYLGINTLEEIDLMVERGEFKEALEEYMSLSQSLNNFFDNVMVMTEDEEVRNNRLSLVKRYYETIRKIFIPSYIVKE